MICPCGGRSVGACPSGTLAPRAPGGRSASAWAGRVNIFFSVNVNATVFSVETVRCAGEDPESQKSTFHAAQDVQQHRAEASVWRVPGEHSMAFKSHEKACLEVGPREIGQFAAWVILLGASVFLTLAGSRTMTEWEDVCFTRKNAPQRGRDD